MPKQKKAVAKNGNGTSANLGFEQKLWAAADKMRGHMDAAEYPPDKQEEATQTVLEQAELLCKDWAA